MKDPGPWEKHSSARPCASAKNVYGPATLMLWELVANQYKSFPADPFGNERLKHVQQCKQHNLKPFINA